MVNKYVRWQICEEYKSTKLNMTLFKHIHFSFLANQLCQMPSQIISRQNHRRGLGQCPCMESQTFAKNPSQPWRLCHGTRTHAYAMPSPQEPCGSNDKAITGLQHYTTTAFVSAQCTRNPDQQSNILCQEVHIPQKRIIKHYQDIRRLPSPCPVHRVRTQTSVETIFSLVTASLLIELSLEMPHRLLERLVVIWIIDDPLK